MKLCSIILDEVKDPQNGGKIALTASLEEFWKQEIYGQALLPLLITLLLTQTAILMLRVCHWALNPTFPLSCN